MTRLWAGLAVAVTATLGMDGDVGAHEFDHPAPSFSPQGPPSANLNAGGENADWELVQTIPTELPHTDLDFFRSGGETYASVGTLAAGPERRRPDDHQLTEGGAVKPVVRDRAPVGFVHLDDEQRHRLAARRRRPRPRPARCSTRRPQRRAVTLSC